ncbi:MAG: acetoin dehydrogenase dihydrolipoyllysine-residue acetyltransferase subunit [Rhizobiaceae bacterium]|nr:MAG: acetoin dehydrogenase dihydrolipoyllysine-residue acetyltransferase subunit [Rhizobiaceae bacterium]
MVTRTLNMPRLGETMDEGRIASWLVEEGHVFHRGEPIVEIETDKTVVEYPALGDGKLTQRLALEGDQLAVGAPLAHIEIDDGTEWPDIAAGEPMAPTAEAKIVDLPMPRLGETMEEGRIVRWLKNEGEPFERGEAIIEIETDKTVAEYPALHAGRLVEILRKENETVAVGEAIARQTIEGEAAIAAPAASPEPGKAAPVPNKTPVPLKTPASLRAAAPIPGSRARATPLARRLARQYGVNIAAIRGSGPRFRVERQDVLDAAGENGTQTTAAANSGDILFTDLPGGRIAYAESGPGTGKPILLLHGFAADHAVWAATASGLARSGYRVVVPDLPAHGATTIEAARIADFTAPLPSFIDRLPHKSGFHLVAHSLGSAAAIALAETRPGLVARLTLVAPAGLGLRIDADFIHGMARAMSAGEISHLLRRLSVRGSELSHSALSQLAADMARGRLIGLAGDAVGSSGGQRLDILPALATLAEKMPVSVVFGLQDRIIPWEQVTALPPRVAIHLMAGSGHMPQWDQPRDFLDILSDPGNGGAR